MSEALPTFLGRYKVLDEVGRGAMGVVYLAKDPVIGRLVALKTFRMAFAAKDQELQQFRARFMREAQSAGILSHPRIVTIHDVVDLPDQGVTFIAMEYVRGTNLKEILHEEKRLELDFVARVVSQVAEGLEYAHSQGVVHRDVKPANILIDAEKDVKIADFGIARLNSSNLTHDGQLLGTPNYMSPEQIKGEVTDHRADIFSLGVLLYEMLSGEKPFRGENLTQVTHRIVYEDATPIGEHVRGLPEGIQRILAKALAKDPDDRYNRAGELADELKRVVAKLQQQEKLNETQEIPPLLAPPELPEPSLTAAPTVVMPVIPTPSGVVIPVVGPAEPEVPAASAPTTVLPVPPPLPVPPQAAVAPTMALPVPPSAAAAPTVVLPVTPALPAAASAPTVVLPAAPAAPSPTPPAPPQAKTKPPATPRAPIGWGRVALLASAVSALLVFTLAGLWFTSSGVPADAPGTKELAQRRAAWPLLRQAAVALADGEPLAAFASLQAAERIAPGVASIRERREAVGRQAGDLARSHSDRMNAIITGLDSARQAAVDRRWQDSQVAAAGVLELDPANAEAQELKARAEAQLARLGLRRTTPQESPSEPAPEVATAPAEPAPEPAPEPAQPVPTDATMALDFLTAQPKGTLTIYLNGKQISRENFDFGRRSQGAGGRITQTFKVPAGAARIQIIVAPPGRPSATQQLNGNFPGGSNRKLIARFSSEGTLTASLE